MVQLLLAKQGREDPLFVTFDSAVRQHRVAPAATRYTDEWTTRIVIYRRTAAGRGQ